MSVPGADFITMLQALNELSLAAGQSQTLAYLIMYVATIFVGNISIFPEFWIVFHGGFGWWGIPVLALVVIAADISGDMLWYSLGKALRNTRAGEWIKNHFAHHEKIEAYLHKRGLTWVFASKFAYAAPPFIFIVGWSQMDFKRFIKVSVVSAVVWVGILMGLSYGLVSSLAPLNTVAVFKHIELLFTMGLVAFIVLNMLVSRLLKRYFARRERPSELPVAAQEGSGYTTHR